MEDKRKDLEDNWTTKFMKEPLRQKIRCPLGFVWYALGIPLMK
jgi:hypothetical protein